MAGTPIKDVRLVHAEAPCDAAYQGGDLEPQARRPPRQSIGHGLRPIAVLLKDPVVLADQWGKARREQVERNLPPHAPRLLGELRDERGDAGSTEAQEVRKDRAAGDQRVEP